MRTRTICGAILIAVGLLIVLAAATLAQQGPEIRVTDSATRADQPDIVIDSNGNSHIAYTDEYGTSDREVWYTMLDSDGNTLIDDTRITADDGDESTRPAIVLDSDDKVHIAWRDQRWDGGGFQEVTYTKLDPYLDDMDGSPAISSTITLVDDTRLSDIGDWSIYGIRMAVDSNDDIHIVWDDNSADSIFYMKIDANGNELVAETVIRSANQWRALPDLALDSNDNVHVAWADSQDTSYDEVYYMMLDNVGNTLIDATLLTPDDSDYSKWTAIVVDAYDQVHIVWQDARGSDKEIWYTKLDPSLDDQNGDAADGDAITVIADTPLTPDDGVKSRHPAVATACGNTIHVTWEEDDDDNIHYMVLDSDGVTVTNIISLTSSGSAYPSTYWTLPYLDATPDGTARVVWCDSRDGAYEVYYTSYATGRVCIFGQMDGHVYDAATTDPIEGATVKAGASARTDAGGYYTMTTSIGVYTATAKHPMYTTVYSPNIEILTDTLTTVDWYLTARGRLFGYVTDYDSGAPLEATIVVSGYGSTSSDPASGYYEMYVDAGTYDLEALASGYITGTATVDIISGQDTQQDFVLAYGVAFEPAPLHVTLDWQTTASFPATLTNRLPVTYPFEFFERSGGFMPALLGRSPNSVLAGWPGPDGFGYTGEDYAFDWEDITIASSDDLSAFLVVPTAPSQVLQTGALLIQDSQAWGSAAMTTILTNNGIPFDTINSSQIPATDFSPYKMILIPSVQGSAYNTIFNNNLAKFEDFIDAGGLVLMSFCTQSDHTPYIQPPFGGTNNYQTDDNNYIEDPAHPIFAGVSNPYSGSSASHNYMSALLPGDRVLVTQGTAPGGNVVMIERDHGGGMLVAGGQTFEFGWSNGQGAGDILENMIPYYYYNWFPSGVPWFGQAPISGTVPASDILGVTTLFSATYAAGVDQPGDYYATLTVNGDPDLKVPVTMTVLPPANMGKVEGYVTDRCLGDPVVEASVHISGGVPITQTTTYPDGYYAAWLIPGTYDLVFTATGYLSHTEMVDIVTGMTTTLDVDLFPDRACIEVEPDGFEVWLITGTLVYTHPTGLDITNDGGQPLDFELWEQEGGYISPTFTLDTVPVNLAPDGPRSGSEFNALETKPVLDRHILQGYCLVAVTAGTDPETAELHNTLDELGYSWLDVNNMSEALNAGADVIIDRYSAFSNIPASDVNTWLGYGYGYVQLGDWPPFFPDSFESIGQGSPVTITVVDGGHPLVQGLPPSWTGLGIWHYGGATDYLSWVTDVGYPNVMETQYITLRQRAVTGAEIGPGRAAYIGFNTYGSAAGDNEKRLLDNAITWTGACGFQDVPWMWEEPISGTVPSDYALRADTNVDIMFTALYTDWVTPMPLGTYSATLIVSDNDPIAATPRLPVIMHIVDQFITPTASFESNSPVCLGQMMVFSNTTTPGVPPETTYLWDLGDGMTSTLESPTHLYRADGVYTVTLEACNSMSQCDTYSDAVEVLPLPLAGFTYDVNGLSVDFTNTSTNADTYWWDFGDTYTSTLEHPSHTYAAGGTYTVTLSASGDCGSDVFSDTVTALWFRHYLPLVFKDY